MRVGYFYANRFAHWVSVNCAFTLTDDDLSYVLAGLSKDGQHVIRREDFLKSVNPETVASEVEEAESSVVAAEEE